MNLKKFLKTLLALAVFTVLVSFSTLAQTTYYVNNNIGLDSYDGLHSTVTGVPGQGPKRTISNAITASSAGDIISVEAFAPYAETITVTKNLTFEATGGTVTVNSLVLNNANASPNDVDTFSGPYSFVNGITLTDGQIAGGSNVTVASALTFTNGNGVAVDAQLQFSGSVNFSYIGAAGTVTTGYELPAAGNTTNFGNLSTAAGVNLKLNEGKTVNGTVTTGGTVDLNGNTLTIVDGNSGNTHSLGGDVTNGTLNFDLTSNAPQTTTLNESAASMLPNVTVTNSDASNAHTLLINTTGNIGSITTSGNLVNVSVANVTTVGDLTNGTTGDAGNGTLTLTAATTVGNVSNTNTGNVVLTAATTITSITNSGMAVINTGSGAKVGNTGLISVNAAGLVTVNGNVVLSSAPTTQTQSGGYIMFTGAAGVKVNGNVWNNLNQTLAVTTTAAYALSNTGDIAFAANAPVTITGDVVNNAVMNGTLTSSTGNNATFQNNGDIIFSATTQLVAISGALKNAASSTSLTLSGPATETFDANGRILFAATGAANAYPAITNSSNFASSATNSGTIVMSNNGSNVTAISVTNTSASSTASNGVIDFGAGAGTVSVTGAVASSGAAGGSIMFPNTNFNAGSISNSRSAAGADILIGSAATAGVTVVTGGDIVNSGSSNITFNSTQDGVVTIGGKLENSGSGSVLFPNLTSGNVTSTSLVISGGKVDLSGAGAAATGNVTVSGNITLNAGTIDFGTAARIFTVNGSNNIIGTATTQPTFANSAATTLTFAAPTPTTLQTLTIGTAGAVWPGPFVINNTTGLAEAFDLIGGNLRVLNNVSFTAGFVAIRGTNQRLFVGDEVNNKSGNFTNTAGYTAYNNSFVSINSKVASTVSGAGDFGNFEVDAVAGAAVSGKFVGIFGLANGSVTGGAAVNFNNSTNYPTIIVNAGSFAVAPTFTSMVNIYYIGTDKTVGNELPAATNKLNNLTVATTNGTNVNGKGVVNVNVATTVNGTLTVNAGQALLLNGASLTMNGSAITLNGDIANVAAANKLILASATGTVITGTGWLPDIQVAAASAGNSISGAQGLVTTLLGADKLRGTDDFDPTTTLANGTIVYAGGTASSLSVAFGSGAKNGTHAQDVTTASGATLTVASNFTTGGTLTHNAGTVTIASGATWTYMGSAMTVTGGGTPSVINGAGTLTFYQLTGAAVSPTITVATGAGSIDVANFVINLGAAGDLLTVGTNDLTLNDSVTVTRGTLQMTKNVTVTGNALTLTGNGSVAGAGILTLNATTAPLTFTYTGAPSISNLTIKNDVVLAGSGTGLNVTTAFNQTAGNLNFSAKDLTISGTFTRTGGTYTATSGYLIISGGSFNKGASSFTIPNLRIASAGNFAFGGAGVVTVTNAFDLAETGAGVVTQQVSATNTLAIDTNVTVTYVSGDLDNAPTFNGAIKLVLDNSASGTVSANVWPASVTVTDLTLNCAGFTATIPGNRNVTTNFNLTSGTIEMGGNSLSTSADAAINVVAGFLTESGSGAFAAGANNNITYTLSGNYTCGPELPAAVNNFTLAGTGGKTLTVGQNVTVAGNMSIGNNINATGKVSVAGNVTVTGGVTLAFNTASSPLTFTGNNQTLALGGNQTIANIDINQTGTNPVVTLTGGNLNVTNNIAFDNGILVGGTNTLLLQTVVQGFTHNTTGNLSHFVGNVQKALAGGATGRFEFPVGTMNAYRPVAFTFYAPGVITTTALTVSADSTNPGGTNGFPLTISGQVVDTTANFSWNISSTVSLGPSQSFDIEFQGTNFTNYSDVANIRVISRLGAVQTNPWVGQNGVYSNFEAVAGLPIVRVTNSTGNIIAQGATFTLGFKKPTPTAFAVSGTVTYANASNSPVKNVVVTLNPGGMTATTDSTGSYSIANVPNGTYTVTASTANAWLGANATDALLASNYYNGTVTLSSMQQMAADVNVSNSINNTDALLIVRRFAGLDNSFAAGNWVFSSPAVTVNGAAVTANVQALVAGDVNASDDVTTLKAQQSVSLISEGTLKVNEKDEFDVPVRVSSSMSLGAVSLRFSYPKDLVTFEGVSSKADMISNDVDGKVTVAWADLAGGKNVLNLKAGESLITLKFKPTANFKTGSQFSVDLDGSYSELAKEDGSVLSNSKLTAASVEAFVPKEFSLKQNYPNPFNPSTTIEYDLPMNASVKLDVYNILGQLVTTLVNNQVQSAGSYKIVWNANSVASGVYFYRITVDAGSQKFTQIQRMMLLK